MGNFYDGCAAGVRPDVVGVEGKTRVRDMEVKTFKFSFQQQLLKCEHHT